MLTQTTFQSAINKDTLITPRLRKTHRDFIFLHQSSYYVTFQAKTLSPPNLASEIHTIRILDSSTQFVKTDFFKAATLFMQEAFYLCSKMAEKNFTFLAEHFEMCKDSAVVVFKGPSFESLSEILRTTNAQMKIDIAKFDSRCLFRPSISAYRAMALCQRNLIFLFATTRNKIAWPRSNNSELNISETQNQNWYCYTRSH